MVLKVYISGMSGNKEVKKRQQRVLMILDSKNIKYEVIDITEPGKEADREFMQTKSTSNGATVSDPTPRHPLPPQIFNEDDYCGDYDAFDLANEIDTLEQFLKLAPADTTNVSSAQIELKKENGEKEPAPEGAEENKENEVKENGEISEKDKTEKDNTEPQNETKEKVESEENKEEANEKVNEVSESDTNKGEDQQKDDKDTENLTSNTNVIGEKEQISEEQEQVVSKSDESEKVEGKEENEDNSKKLDAEEEKDKKDTDTIAQEKTETSDDIDVWGDDDVDKIDVDKKVESPESLVASSQDDEIADKNVIDSEESPKDATNKPESESSQEQEDKNEAKTNGTTASEEAIEEQTSEQPNEVSKATEE